MKLIDTHAHLYLPEFGEDRELVVQSALDSGIEKILLPNIDERSIQPMMELCKRFNGICFPMMGLHPSSVREDFPEVLQRMRKLLKDHSFVAIGETGIDLYWDKSCQELQEKAFAIQMEIAVETGLPVVIHARESFSELFRIIDRFSGTGIRGVFHSFTGGPEEVNTICGYDFYFGINGISTFKNSGLQETLKQIPLNRLLLETDSPYLSPVPKRGQRNESSHLKYICAKVAEIIDKKEEELAEITRENSVRLFNKISI